VADASLDWDALVAAVARVVFEFVPQLIQ